MTERTLGTYGTEASEGIEGTGKTEGTGETEVIWKSEIELPTDHWCDGIRWVLVLGATVVLTTRIRWVLVEEEEILFCFLYVRRTVWFFIRKPLPTQTWASSTVEEEFFPFSLEEEILFCFFYIRRTVWCSIRKPLPTQTQASSSVEEEKFFSLLFGRRILFCSVYVHTTEWCSIRKLLPTQTRASCISRRRRILFLSLWKKKYYSAFSMCIGQCCVSLENLWPSRHKHLYQQKQRIFLPFSLEEDLCFYLFYFCRTVLWFN